MRYLLPGASSLHPSYEEVPGLGADHAFAWQDVIPSDIKSEITRLTGVLPNDPSDLFPRLALPLALPLESPGPWIEKSDGIYSGANKIIKIVRSGVGAFVGDYGVKDAFQALGASTQVAGALAKNTSAGIAVATALMQGQPKAAIMAGLDAISGVLAPIAPWGTAAVVAIQAGKLLGFFGGEEGPPPPTLGGVDLETLQRNLMAGRIASVQHAEVLGRFVGGLSVEGAGRIEMFRETMLETIRARMLEIFRGRAARRPIDAAANNQYPGEYTRLSLVLANSGNVWQTPGAEWFTPLDVKYAYEMVSFGLPRALIYGLLAMTSLWSVSWAWRGASETARWAQPMRETIQRNISQRMFPPPDVQGGVYAQRTFPAEIAKKFLASAPAQLDLSLTLPGLGVKTFPMGSSQQWKMTQVPPPIITLTGYRTGRTVRDPSGTTYHFGEPLSSPTDMFRRAQMIAMSDREWMRLRLSDLAEGLAEAKELESASKVSRPGWFKMAKKVAVKAAARAQAARKKKVQAGIGTGGLLLAAGAVAYLLTSGARSNPRRRSRRRGR